MRKIIYIHQSPDWPNFTWNYEKLGSMLAHVRHRQGRLIGRMEGLGFSSQSDAVLATLTQDVLKSSEIEGEILNPDQVRSSIARRLGIDIAGAIAADRDVEGVVEMMLDATQRFADPLTQTRLFGWHAALFPTGYGGIHPIRVGAWRDDSKGAMQVISGPISRERVHFEAPAAKRLQQEMNTFLAWANHTGKSKGSNSNPAIDPVLKAAVAHLWFVTIHPFDDGNGRIARAIADWALARSEGSSQRFYSMSSQIRAERGAYYEMLEHTQKSTLDITDWLEWFLACLDRAITATETTLGAVFRKATFWDKHADGTINLRQQKMLNKLFDGFEGKLTSTKWAMIAKCSQDTAQRDIQGLIDQGILVKDAAGGRSTSYSLADFQLPSE